MPFESEAQRRFMYSQHPELAKEFESATPKGKHLPEHVPQKMSDGGLVDIIRNMMLGNKADAAVKHDVTEASAADAIDPVVSRSTDTAKGYADGGKVPTDEDRVKSAAMVDKDEPGLQDATASDFLLPYLLGNSTNVMEGAGSKLADEAGAIFPQKAPLMEDAIEGATTKDIVEPNKIEVYVKGIQKGAPGGSGDIKIYGVKGTPEALLKEFGDADPGSVPEHILQAKGLLPQPGPAIPQAAPNRYAEGGYAEGGYPHVTFMEDQTPEGVAETTHLAAMPKMADGGVIEPSHDEKLKSIYKAMGMKKYADGGEVTPSDGTVDMSQLPGAIGSTPSPNDPGFWDQIKAALAQVGKPVMGAMAPAQAVGEAATPAVAAAAPAAVGAINKLTGASLPIPAAPASAMPNLPPAAAPVAPAATPAAPIAAPAMKTAIPAAKPGPDLSNLFNQDTSALTAGVNPEDRQALVAKLQGQQHGLGSTIAEAVAGLGDALATKGGRDQHSLQNIFSMQKDQRQEALANFDQARQDRLQKLDIQTKMGNNAIQGLAAKDAYGTDEHLNKMLGAPPGTMHKDLPLYFQAKSAAVAQQEKDADLYMKAHAQAASEVDSAVKNASVLSIKPSPAQLEASGRKLADTYYNRAKGNILVKPSDGSAAQWIPAQNIGKAKQMDPGLQIIPG